MPGLEIGIIGRAMMIATSDAAVIAGPSQSIGSRTEAENLPRAEALEVGGDDVIGFPSVSIASHVKQCWTPA
jgi:hypothetical protein